MIDLEQVIDESIFTQENPTPEQVLASVKTEPVKKTEKSKEIEEPLKEDLIDDSTFNIETEQVISADKQADAIKATAQFLQSIGGFSELPKDFEATPDALVELLQTEAFNKAKEHIEQREENLPSIVKDLIDNWEEGMSEDVLVDIYQSRASQIKLNSITEDKIKEDVNLQKSLYKQFLKETTKFSDTKINKMIQDAEDDFTLEELVKDEALPELKKEEVKKEKEFKTRMEQQRVQAEKDYQDTLKSYKSAIEKTDEVLGVKLSKKEREELFNISTKPVGKDKAGNPVFYAQAVYNQDPIAYNMAVNLVLMKTKGLKENDGFLQAASTKAAKTMQKELESSQVKHKNAMEASLDLETSDTDITKKFYETYSFLKP